MSSKPIDLKTIEEFVKIAEDNMYSIYPGWSYACPIADQQKYKIGDQVKDTISHAPGEIISYNEEKKLYMVKHTADWLGVAQYKENELTPVLPVKYYEVKCECGSDIVFGTADTHSRWCPKSNKKD